jgi:predicted lipoprotein with Yx(FWY)xxD motif
MARERGIRRARAATATLAATAVASLSAAALGAATLTVKSASDAPLHETVVVNPAGRTLYALSGESSHRLLCKSSECARLWPPLTLPSRTTHLKAASGVHGALGTIRRPNGSLQVTLRGKPLYRFSGDSGPAQGHGEGIQSFGGVWHAVTAAAGSPPPAPAQPAPETMPPYGY